MKFSEFQPASSNFSSASPIASVQAFNFHQGQQIHIVALIWCSTQGQGREFVVDALAKAGTNIAAVNFWLEHVGSVEL